MAEAEIVLRPSKLRTIFYLLVCAAFVAIGVKALREKPAVGWLCTIFFGFGVVVFVVQLFPERLI